MIAHVDNDNASEDKDDILHVYDNDSEDIDVIYRSFFIYGYGDSDREDV
jgi:hypothetical protein